MLLKLLAEQESYGYELATRVHELGLSGVADGSIYPALSRLERDGHVVSRLVPSQQGPARKYYRLSERGAVALAERQAAWNSLVGVLAPLLKRPLPTPPKEAAP